MCKPFENETVREVEGRPHVYAKGMLPAVIFDALDKQPLDGPLLPPTCIECKKRRSLVSGEGGLS